MKHLKALSIATSAAALFSSIAIADPVELSSDLHLIGFSGGTCNINVNANANASNINLDNPSPTLLEVGTVDTQCDYEYRLEVSSNDRAPIPGPFGNGQYALMHYQDPNVWVEYEMLVDGIFVDPGPDSFLLGLFAPGENVQLPISVNTPFGAPIPGIYQGTVSFSLIID